MIVFIQHHLFRTIMAEYGLKVLSMDIDEIFKADMVFVHELHGDRVDTWSKKKKKNLLAG